MLSQIRKSDTIEDYKKGGKIRNKVTSNNTSKVKKQKQKQKQKQVVNIKNIINIEKKVRKSTKTKSKPVQTPSPAPTLPSYSTFNKFFQPSPDQNFKSISMGNNIPNADNINAISNRVSNLILGRIQNNVNNANSNFVLPQSFDSNLSDLAIGNDSNFEMKEREEKIQEPVEMDIKEVGKYDVNVLIPEKEAIGRNYIEPVKSESDRLALNILAPESKEEKDGLPVYAQSSELSPEQDETRLRKMIYNDVKKEARQMKIQYNIGSGENKRKLRKDEIISEILAKRWGIFTTTSSLKSSLG